MYEIILHAWFKHKGQCGGEVGRKGASQDNAPLH